ncbi:MAG: GNAT family N-acetyltransferase [Burkholderiaceae bacterium]|nr:GNAT family N-acetyltransferase [Microbacteriaceae bacterium]
MVSFREVPVTDDTAHMLLTEYFASRAESFPVSMGTYHTAFPDPALFTPPRGVFVVVSDQAADVGCGGIRLLTHGAGVTRFEIKHLWVQPGSRGTGLGRALLDELEARARAFGASEVVLDTNLALEAAGGLYRSSGYGEIAPYNDNPNATHWFAKNLTTELE